MTIGEKIKQKRENIGMSQDELAKRMGYKDRSSISKIEKASDDNIYLDTVEKAADILNCSPLYLMGWGSEQIIVDTRDMSERQKEQIERILAYYMAFSDLKKKEVDDYVRFLSKSDQQKKDGQE